MQHGQVKAEGRYSDRLRVDVDPGDLRPQDLPQFVRRERRSLLPDTMTDNAAEGVHQENSRSASRVHYARPLLQQLIGEGLRKDIIHQGARRIVAPLVSLLLPLRAVEQLVNTANQLN